MRLAPVDRLVSFADRPWSISKISINVAGSGALQAVSEQSGAVLWIQSVLGSGDSSPVVTSSGVYLAYPCPAVYDFDPVSGALIWHVGPSSCSVQASGPRTAVLS